MNQRYFIFLLFVCRIVLHAEAQVSPQEKLIDSLKLSSLGPQHDTVRAAKLDLISYYYEHLNPDSGVVYAQASFLLAQKANWKRGQILALMDLGNNYRAKSMFVEGIEKGELALALLETEKMPQVELAVLSNVSLLYKDLGYSAKALEYLYRALELENQSEKNKVYPSSLKTSVPYIWIRVNMKRLIPCLTWPCRCRFKEATQPVWRVTCRTKPAWNRKKIIR